MYFIYIYFFFFSHSWLPLCSQAREVRVHNKCKLKSGDETCILSTGFKPKSKGKPGPLDRRVSGKFKAFDCFYLRTALPLALKRRSSQNLISDARLLRLSNLCALAGNGKTHALLHVNGCAPPLTDNGGRTSRGRRNGALRKRRCALNPMFGLRLVLVSHVRVKTVWATSADKRDRGSYTRIRTARASSADKRDRGGGTS